MNTKIYLTIVAVLAVIYGLAFVLIPDSMLELYGVKMPQPNATLNIQFFGSALLSLGMAVEAVLGPLPPPTFRNG